MIDVCMTIISMIFTRISPKQNTVCACSLNPDMCVMFFPDYLFGKQPDEVQINLCETKDKFMVDWCPETSPELEEMARAEEIRVVMEGNRYTPAIWIISDGMEPPRVPRSGPRVAFGKNV